MNVKPVVPKSPEAAERFLRVAHPYGWIVTRGTSVPLDGTERDTGPGTTGRSGTWDNPRVNVADPKQTLVGANHEQKRQLPGPEQLLQ